MHEKSETHVKWAKKMSTERFTEAQGTRQGGVAGPLEYRQYVKPMVTQLEENCENDQIGGHPTNVVALADDIAPTSIGKHPREAIHRLQNMLYIVEDWGTQLHIKFGLHKCELLITAKPHLQSKVEDLLKTEPELLTFYGCPVTIVQEYYTHIGVPQAPNKQSTIAIDYRIARGVENCYTTQEVTRNSIKGSVQSQIDKSSKHITVQSSPMDWIHLKSTKQT